MKFKFQNALPMWSNDMIGSSAWAFVIKMKKKISVLKKSVKSLRYTDKFFSRQITTTWKLTAICNYKV